MSAAAKLDTRPSLTLTRPLASIDLETTGPFVGVDRIVDIAIVTLYPDGRTEEWQTLVNPGMPIPTSATAIHGITDSMVKDAPRLQDVANTIVARLNGVDFAGYNVRRFDLPFISSEMDRVFGLGVCRLGGTVVDAMSIFHHFAPRDLAAAHRTYVGGDLEGAHRAIVDARASLAVLMGQMAEHEELPETPEAIANLLRDPDAIDEEGELIRRDKWICLGFGKHRGHSLEWVWRHDRRYLEWMSRGEFMESTRQILCGFAFDTGLKLASVMPKRKAAPAP